MKSIDLNVDSPDKVAGVLNDAADAFDESVGELQSAWQDKNAGVVWGKIAKILRRAAASVEKTVRLSV